MTTTKKYTILAFRATEKHSLNGKIWNLNKGGYNNRNSTTGLSLDCMLNEGNCVKSGHFEIYAVRRNSDGEIFTIGDKVERSGLKTTIKSFKLSVGDDRLQLCGLLINSGIDITYPGKDGKLVQKVKEENKSKEEVDFTIVAFKSKVGDAIIRCKDVEPGLRARLEQGVNANIYYEEKDEWDHIMQYYNIYSVIRNSDSQLFSIGDSTVNMYNFQKNGGEGKKIIKIELSSGNSKIFFIRENYIKLSLEDAKKLI